MSDADTIREALGKPTFGCDVETTQAALAALDRLVAERDGYKNVQQIALAERDEARDEWYAYREQLRSAEAERDEWKHLAGYVNVARAEAAKARVTELEAALLAWQQCSPAHRYECSPFASEDAVCSCGLQKARDLTNAALAKEEA